MWNPHVFGVCKKIDVDTSYFQSIKISDTGVENLMQTRTIESKKQSIVSCAMCFVIHNVHCQDKMIPVVFPYYATEFVVYESSSLDISLREQSQFQSIVTTDDLWAYALLLSLYSKYALSVFRILYVSDCVSKLIFDMQVQSHARICKEPHWWI